MKELLNNRKELEENLGIAARNTELEERLVLRDGVHGVTLTKERRAVNVAIINNEDRNELFHSRSTTQILRDSLRKFPLAHKCGFISCLEEGDLKLAESSIMDLSYLGVIPKKVLGILSKDVELDGELRNRLIALVIGRTMFLQRVINFLLREYEKNL